MLQGVITAIVTPMNKDGQIDFEELDNLVEWQINSGVSGIVAVGSTGDAAALSTAEHLAVSKRIIEAAKGRVKIIVGSGMAATVPTLEFIRKVNQLEGVDYLMCLTPYYIKPTQEGLYQHFAKVAEISKFPVILYNVPGRTACNMSDETILRLANNYPNVVGVKDATGDISRCLNLAAKRPTGFMLFSGDDASALAFILAGGDGVISVVSNLRPRLFSRLCQLALSGNREHALVINNQLQPLYTALFCEANPIPVKWGLFAEKMIKSPVLRLPLTELSSCFQNDLKNILMAVAD